MRPQHQEPSARSRQLRAQGLVLILSWAMALLGGRTAQAQPRPLARGLGALYQQGSPGISRPHHNVVRQLRQEAGGRIRGPVYVVRYGTEAARKLTGLMKERGFGVIYKGSAWTGHTMAWIGGMFTDAVPGRMSFSDGQKTRWHEFQPLAERPQLIAAYEVPMEVLPGAVEHARIMASKHKSQGADCSGYICDLGRTFSQMTRQVAEKTGAGRGLARLGQHLRSYLPPTQLRNAALREADAIILMTSEQDWRKPESPSFSINDWNGK